MKGLDINFSSENPTLTFKEKSGFDLVVQNILVNLGQLRGTSKIFPGKGTTMLKESLEGGIIDSGSSNRVGGMAAVDTLYFTRAHDKSGAETVSDISVIPDVYENGSLVFKVTINTTGGRTIGAALVR